MPTYQNRRRQRRADVIKVQIEDVNLNAHQGPMAQGRDRKDWGLFDIDLSHGVGGAFPTPTVGEVWWIRRGGRQWVLDHKVDSTRTPAEDSGGGSGGGGTGGGERSDVPSNVVLGFNVREKKTTLTYRGFVTFDEVTTDANGDPNTPEHYLVDWVPCTKNSNIITNEKVRQHNWSANDPVIDAEDDPAADYYVELPGNVPRPKVWYWKARVRAISSGNSKGAWSDWTEPVLPVKVGLPQPPAPDNVELDFKWKDTAQAPIFSAVTRFDDVNYWDIPGYDYEDDVSSYQIQIEPLQKARDWESGHDYTKGNPVLSGGNSYVCIKAHTSSGGNTPPNATYWYLATSIVDGSTYVRADPNGENDPWEIRRAEVKDRDSEDTWVTLGTAGEDITGIETIFTVDETGAVGTPATPFIVLVSSGTVDDGTFEKWLVTGRTSLGANLYDYEVYRQFGDTPFLSHSNGASLKWLKDPYVYKVGFPHIERPKTVYWRTRVRSKDRFNRLGAWSDWTVPITPWQSIDWEVPPPKNLVAHLQIREYKTHPNYRLVARFKDAAPNGWNLPGGDLQDDLHHYNVAAEAILPDPDGYIDGGNGSWYRIPDRKIGTLAALVNPADTTATINLTAGLDNSFMQIVDTAERFFLRFETVDPNDTGIQGQEVVAVSAVDEPTNAADLSRVVNISRNQKGTGDHGHNAGDNVYLLTEHRLRANVHDKDEDDPGHYNDHYTVDLGHIPHATRLFWHVKAQSIDTFGHKSPWTAWTPPLNPGTDPDLVVDAPSYVALSFDKVHRSRHVKHRAIVEWSEVAYIAPDGDREPDTSGYGVQLATSDGDRLDLAVTASDVTFHVLEMKKGPGPVPFYSMIDDELVKVTARVRNTALDNLWTYTVQRGTKGTTAAIHPEGGRLFQYPFFQQTVSAKQDKDPNNFNFVAFPRAEKWNHYKARVRTRDRYNRASDWTAWTSVGTPSDVDPPASPTNVLVDIDEHKVHFTWDYPVDERDEDPQLGQPSIDVAFFQAQLSDHPGFGPNNIMRFDRNILGQSKTWRMRKPSRSATYYVRVRAVDSSGNKSPWVSDSGAQNGVPTPDAPTITFDTAENSEKLRANVLLTKGVTYLDNTDDHDALIDGYEFRLDPSENTKVTAAVTLGASSIAVRANVSITMPYSIWVDNEKMTVNSKTGGSSLTWHVTRAVGGTTQATHRDKSKVFYFKDTSNEIIRTTGEETSPGDPVLAIFKTIMNRRYYRARVKAVDTQGRWGNFSSYSTVVRAVDLTAPDPPQSVAIHMAQHHVLVEWEPESDPGDDAAEGNSTLALADDLDYFQVQLARDSGFTDIVRTERAGRTTSKTFRVKKPTTTTTFYARVRAVDERGNKSAWTSANSLMTDPPAPVTPSLQFNLFEDPNKLSGKVITNTVDWAEDDISRYEFILQPTQWTEVDGDVTDVGTTITVGGNHGEYDDEAEWWADVPTPSFVAYTNTGEQVLVTSITGALNHVWHVTRGYNGTTQAPINDGRKLFYFPQSLRGTRKHTVHAQDEAVTTSTGNFPAIPADKYYKAKVRSISRDNRQSTFSSWTTIVKSADGASSGDIGGGGIVDGGVFVPPVSVSDGFAPSFSPTPTVRGGVGYVTANWAAVPNNDKVTYEVHVFRDIGYRSDILPTAIGGTQIGFPPPDDDERFTQRVAASFTPGPTTLYAEIDGTLQSIYALPDGTPLTLGTTYAVKIIAKDVDGSAIAGSQGSAVLLRLPSSSTTSDGFPPGLSPTPVVTSGPMLLNVAWPAVPNSDVVTYKVYCSITTGFTPNDGSNLVGTTTGHNFPITKLFGGTALTTDTTYFVKVVASDADGAAPAGSQGSGTINAVPTSGSTSDNSPPIMSPTPIVKSGPNFLSISWAPVINNDPVSYKIFCSATRNFVPSNRPYTDDFGLLTPHIATATLPATFEYDDGPWSRSDASASNLIGITTDTNFIITKLNDGVPLLLNTTYYVKIIAYDVDGAATIGPQSSGIVSVTDGKPPSTSPTPTVLGGVGFLAVRWEPPDNADPLTYEVHISLTNPPAGDATSFVGEVEGTLFFVKMLADGSALQYFEDPSADIPVPVDYYVAIRAKDNDGAATLGTSVVGHMIQASTVDIAADTITTFSAIIAEAAIGDAHIQNLAVGKLLSGELDGTFELVGGIFAGVTPGVVPTDGVQGISWDSDGFRLYDVNGSLVLNFPSAGSENPSVTADIATESISINDGYSYRDDDGDMEASSVITMASGIRDPAAPQLTQTWEQTKLPVGITVDGIFRNVAQWDAITYDPEGGAFQGTETFLTLPYCTANFNVDGVSTQQPLFLVEVNASDLTVNRVGECIDARLASLFEIKGGPSNFVDYGVTRCGDQIFIMVTFTEIVHTFFGEDVETDVTMVLSYDQDDLSYQGREDITSTVPGSGYPAWITRSDETNITTAVPVVVYVNGSNFAVLKKFSVVSGNLDSVTSSVTTTGFSSSTQSPWGAIYDGSNIWIVWGGYNAGNTGTVKRYSTAGAYQSTHDFYNSGRRFFGGIGYKNSGTEFYSCDDTYVYTYGTYEWALNGPKWWAGTTWRNNSLETTTGPRKSITPLNRSKLVVNEQGPYPTGGTGGWTSRVYLKPNTTDPNASTFGNMKLHNTLSDPTLKIKITAYDSLGAADPAVNGLAAIGIPAIIQSADGESYFKGDGSFASPITRTIWLPPASIELDHDVPASKATFRGTSPNQYETVGFDKDTTTGIQTMFRVPDDWDSGPFTMTLIYVCTIGETKSVVFQWTYKQIVVGTTSGVAVGTTPSNDVDTFAHGATPVRSNPLTLGTPAAAGDLIRVQLQRMGANGSDDCTGTTHLLGIEISYSASR